LQAQTERSGGGEGQRIMQQYQQLAAERTQLEAQVASLKHNLDDANAQLATVKKDRDSLKARAAAAGANTSAMAQLTADKEAAQKSADQEKARLNELVIRFRETATDLKQVESDREQLRGQLRERSAAYDQCAADNLSLYELTGDVLNRYEHVGLFTRVSAGEPFTRITRARIDNLVDQYRARALELRVKSAASDASDKGAGKPSPKP
jgi:chromosome segregation ATPase